MASCKLHLCVPGTMSNTSLGGFEKGLPHSVHACENTEKNMYMFAPQPHESTNRPSLWPRAPSRHHVVVEESVELPLTPVRKWGGETCGCVTAVCMRLNLDIALGDDGPLGLLWEMMGLH
ncbi:hypothetical protein F2P79_005302 [Pimephales promelas]|nr:hypothetical protein F2P79_005302 [Pimephales promelas]